MRHGIQILTASAIALMSAMTSCNNGVVWTRTQTPGSDGWGRDRTLLFQLAEEDSMLWKYGLTHTATLSFRYTRDCEVHKMKFLIEKESLEAVEKPDTIEVEFFTSEGSPIGQRRGTGIAGIDTLSVPNMSLGVYERDITLFSDRKLQPMTGVSVTPLTSLPVKGITGVTLTLR